MARLRAVAVQAIIAIRVVSDVVARVCAFVTRVVGTGHAIVAVGGRASLAAQRCVAGLGPIAPEAVVTVRIIRDVVARIRAFVARVIRAGYPVVAIHRGPGLTVAVRITGLRPVAVSAVIAGRVAGALAGGTGPAAVDPVLTLILDAVAARRATAGSPKLNVVNVPAAILPPDVGGSHGPAQVHRRLVVCDGRDVKLLLTPRGVGHLCGVFPNRSPGAPVVADPNVGVIVEGLFDAEPPLEAQGHVGQRATIDGRTGQVSLGEVVLVIAVKVVSVYIAARIPAGGIGSAILSTTPGRLTPGPQTLGRPPGVGIEVPLVGDGQACVGCLVTGIASTRRRSRLAGLIHAGLGPVAPQPIVTVGIPGAGSQLAQRVDHVDSAVAVSAIEAARAQVNRPVADDRAHLGRGERRVHVQNQRGETGNHR